MEDKERKKNNHTILLRIERGKKKKKISTFSELWTEGGDVHLLFIFLRSGIYFR